MGFPMHKAAGRAALIGVMLGGGLLYAGISQAQEAGDQDGASRAERAAELVAAAGGPAAGAHLVAFTRDAAAVDPRDDDVAAEPAVAPAPAQTPQPVAQAVQAQPVALTNAAAPNPAGRR